MLDGAGALNAGNLQGLSSGNAHERIHLPALAQVPGGILGRAVLQLAHGARALGPLRFSGLMDRETAFDSRNRLLILFIMPLYIFQKSHFIYDIGFIFLDRIIVEEICFINIFL